MYKCYPYDVEWLKHRFFALSRSLLMLNRWSQILLGARGFAFSRFRRASAAWRRLGAFALSRETALARENADFSSLVTSRPQRLQKAN
jgi:hypothetical protein